MPTLLTKPVSRETTKCVGGLPVVLTIAPLGAQNETLLALRLKGQRTVYTLLLSDVYRLAALWHGQKVAKAKREARKFGVPWQHAKREFDLANRVPKGSAVTDRRYREVLS